MQTSQKQYCYLSSVLFIKMSRIDGINHMSIDNIHNTYIIYIHINMNY